MSKQSTVTIEESGDTTIIRKNGVEVDITGNDVVVHTTGHLELQPVAASDAAQKVLKIGDEIIENGVVTAIYAGLTADGKQQILAMPTDLDVTKTFNDAAAAVYKLNADKALGHNDWQIPALDNLHVLQKNQSQGKLAGTFKTAAASGSGFPSWYWSSTPDRDYPADVGNVRFSDGNELWTRKDGGRLSCRPVRLVAAPSLG
jgi:hypothetical protein